MGDPEFLKAHKLKITICNFKMKFKNHNNKVGFMKNVKFIKNLKMKEDWRNKIGETAQNSSEINVARKNITL